MTLGEQHPGRRHQERSISVGAEAAVVFRFVDDHRQFSSHMSNSSWMMLGSRMTVEAEGDGRDIGSHIRMQGTVLGMRLSLDEVVTRRIPPLHKEWETIGEPRLVVIGAYRMGFHVTPLATGSRFRVFIDYALPQQRRWLGRLFGDVYARWCLAQMAAAVSRRFP